MVIASGRRGRGFKSRHPDAKTAGQRLCAIEPRWARVTNCVTIGFFSGGASLTLWPLGGFTVVISAGRGSRNRNQADDRDAKPATLIHPARASNQQVRALKVDESRRGTTALLWWIPSWAWQCVCDHHDDRLRQMP
jgi:hypothetical protein